MSIKIQRARPYNNHKMDSVLFVLKEYKKRRGNVINACIRSNG